MTMLTIAGLMNHDDTIFDEMAVPEGMDRSMIVDAILMECVELEILIPDPDVLKRCVNAWSNKQLSVWSRMWKAMNIEYNPLWNKDGTIIETEKAKNGSESKVSAYNTENYVNSGRIDSNADIERKRVEQGNIGVTTSQEMLKQEIEISKFNVYDYIAQDFKSRFCLCVY